MHYTIHREYPDLPQELAESVLSALEEKHNLNLSKFDGSKFNISERSAGHIDNTYSVSDIEGSLGLPGSEAEKRYPDLSNFTFIDAPEDVNKWAKENISPYCHANIQEFSNGSFFFPHKDLMRVKAINYLIETGGNEVRTCFYEPKKEYSDLPIYARTFIPYERIELVESITFTKGEWHSIDVSKIHSVENIDPEKRRVSLSLSFLGRN